MAKPEKKASKRVRRAVRMFAGKAADRFEEVVNDPTSVTPAKLAEYAANQLFEGVEAWLGIFRALAGEPPTVFLDADLSGGGPVNPNTTVDLDEAVNNVGNLTSTSLISPGVANTLTMTLAPVGGGPSVEQITVTVNVPNNQANGLYSGFIALHQAVQVKVYVWVHI